MIVSRLCLLTLLLPFLLGACAVRHSVMLNPSVKAPATSSSKLPVTVAVVFPESMKSYRKEAPSIWLNGELHNYEFSLGRSLCQTLFRSISALYENSVEKSRVPAPGEREFILVFSLTHTQIDVSVEEGRFKPAARAYSLVTVSVELFNGKTLALLRSFKVSGRGFLIRPLDVVSSREAEKVFTQAIETSLQDVADRVADLLAGGTDKPMKM